jgi:hypothetical protein
MVDLSKPISNKQLAVLMVLTDLDYHSSKELQHLCEATPVRDVIKGLRNTHKLLIHGRGLWRLDARHINGDSYADLIARAEAKVKHCNNSASQAVREANRVPDAIEKKKVSNKELIEIKNKTY